MLSSLGWVDGDAIWCFDAAAGTTRSVPQNTGARYTSLHGSDTERFVAVHHFDGKRFSASVGLFSAPEITVSSVSYENGRSSLTGNADAWHGLPHLFVEYFTQTWNDGVLVKIDAGHVHIQRLEWYDASYDKGYESPVNVIALLDPTLALVSVSRRSDLIVHDLETGKAQRTVSLANRHGNPKMALRGTQLWATDYDTLTLVDVDTWRVLRSKRLQGAEAGTNQFIGDFTFSPDGTCCVARPYSGDVVAVDERMKVRRSAKLGRQPLEAIELPGGEVIARDWKTGDLLRGRMLRRAWWQGVWG